MADGLGDIFVGLDDFRKFSADSFLQNANRLIGDVWTQHTIDNIPQMAGDIWTQHVTNQLPNLTSMLAPPASPQSPAAAPPDPFASITSPSTTPTIPTVPAPFTGADSGTPPPAPPPAPAAGVPAPSTPTDTGNGLIDVARQAAQAAGIDPDIFVKQIQQESGFNPNAKSPAGAIGIAQFMPATAQGMGVDPTNPVDALHGAARLMADNLKRYGGDYAKALAAYNAGPGNVDKYGGVPPFEETQRYVKNILSGAGEAAQQAASGAGQAVQSVASTVGGAVQEAGQQAAKFVGNLVPNQFGDPNLSTDEAYAACGPAAAIAFARANGRNPTLREAVDLARSVGWTTAGGMNGIANEKALLDKMGITSTLDPNPTWDKIAADASSGNPVAISTPRHYFVADGFDPQTGKYHVGASGTAFRAGAEWMTAEQISQIGGGVNGALFADHPSSPQPSVAVADQQAQKPVQNALSQLGAPTDQQAASTGQPQSLWDRLGGGISDVFKNVFGGGGSLSTPPSSGGGGGFGAVPPGGQNPLSGALGQLGQAAQSGLSNVAAMRGAANAVNLPPASFTTEPLAPGQQPEPTSTQLIQHAEEQKNRAIEENNPLRDVPLLGGLTTGVAQAIDPLMFAAGPVFGRAAAALPVGEGIVGSLARGATQGAGFGAIQGATQPEADVGSTLRGAAIGAGLGAAGEGGLAALERFRPPETAFASTAGREGNFLRSSTIVPNSDPRPAAVGGQPGLPNVKAVMQQNLAEVLAEDATLYHETSVPNARAILQRVEAGPRNQSIWTSDSRDLALGQGGKGVMLEFDPALVNGGAGENPAKAFSAQAGMGTEYQIDKTLRGAVRAIVVKTQRQADQLAADPLLARRFDFEAAQQTPEGIRIPYAGQPRGATVPTVPDVTAEIPSAPVSLPPQTALPSTAGRLSDEEAFTLHQDLGRQWQELENQAAGLEARSAEAFNPGLKARYANEAQRLRDQQDTLMQQADYLEQHGSLPPDTAPTLPQETFSQPAALPEPSAATAPLPTSPLGSTSILTSPLFQRLKTMRGTPEEQAALRPPDVGDAGNILLDKFPAEARPFLSDMADTFGQFAGQRRGVITDDQAMHNAAETALGTTIDQWIKTPAGKAFNQEQAIALGQTLAKVGREYDGLRTTVQAARQAGNVTPVMEAELADKALQLASLEGVRAGATAEAGRALRAFRQELQGAFGSAPGQRPDKAIQQAFKVLGGTEQFDQWVQEYAKIDPADTMARAKMLQTLTNPSAWDKLAAWRYASMLSSWQTHIQNAASNTGQALARPLRLAAGGYLKEASADVKGMLEAIPEAGAIFSQTLSSGISTGTLQKAETIRPRPFGEGPVGRAISLPTDLLAAADDFFRHINFQGAYRSAAYREAGGNLAKYDDLLANPRPDLVEEAAQASKVATFQEDPGEFVNRLLRLRQTPGPAGLAVQFVLPFIRTPANITRQGVSFALKPITGTVGAARAGLAGDVRTARLEAGQAALASLFEAGIAVKAANGELSAEGPQDAAARDQLRSQGWQDHSIKLGDKWYSYTQWGPASIPMAAIAAGFEGAREGQRPGQNMAADVLARTARGVFSATYLQSLGDVLKAVSGDSEAITYLQNLGASTAGSLVPFGGAISAAARTFDPVEHAPSRTNPVLGTAQQFETRIPGLRQTVPVRQDVLGEPFPTAASQTPLAGLTRISQSRPQPALEVLGNVGMRVGEPPDTVSLRPGVSIKLTEDDKRQFQQFQGTLVEQIVGPLANDRAFQTAPQDIQRRILDQLLTKARDAAEKQTIGTIGGQDLNDRITAGLGLRMAPVPALARP